jgi:parallel beta-helix repeat protein
MQRSLLLKSTLVALLVTGFDQPPLLSPKDGQLAMNFNHLSKLPPRYGESSSLLSDSLFRASSRAYEVQLARLATSAQGTSAEKALVQIASFFLSEGKYNYHKTGSGVIVHSSGIVLTNVHVIRDTGLQGCTITIPNPPRADLVVILIQDPAKPGEPPEPKLAVDLRGLTGAALAHAIPAEDPSLDLAILRINKRVAGKEPPKNLHELVKAVQDNTLELVDLYESLESLPLWDTAALEIGQDVQLAGYPAPKPELPLTRLIFTEGPVLEKRPEGTMVLDRAFATYGFSGGALIEKRSGFLIGILCGGQSLETPAGPLVLAVGRALDAKVQQLLNKVPEIKRHPVPRFTFTPAFPKPGETVTLDASDSFDPDGRISKYDWDLDGDGKPDAHGVKVQRTFQNDARVTLWVTDGDGLQAQRTQRVILDRREQLQQTQQQCKPIQIGTRTFASIGDAIEAAQPGETITVGPGTCQENLVITKSLKLQGAGREKTILLGDGRAPVIAVCPRKVTGESACPQPVEVIIAGFTIRNGLHALQALANAQVTVRESELLESVQQGVDTAFGADVTLVNNRLSRNDEEGFVLEGGKANLQGNTIADNGDEGVLIKNLRTHARIIAADATLVGNTIEGNRSFGLFVTQQAKAQIQGGRISRNGSNGLEADEQADLKVITAEILENAGDGVHLFEATAAIQGSVIKDHQKSFFSKGLWVSGSSTVTLTNSTVSGNCHRKTALVPCAGIFMLGSAQVALTHSTVSDNYHGLWLEDRAQATLTNSIVSSNRFTGLWLISRAQATLSNSIVSDNCHRPFIICGGVFIGDSAQVTLTHSSVSDNEYNGLELSSNAQAILSYSTVSNNWRDGLKLWDSAQATLEDNIIEGNRGCGINSSSDQAVRGSANRMRNNGNDLCGNLSAHLRVPLRPEIETELRWPASGFASLQEAIDALRPGGVLVLAPGSEQTGGVTIAKPLTIRVEPGNKAAVVKGRTDEAPVLSLIEGAQVTLQDLEITEGGVGLNLGGSAQATLTNSTVSGNINGLWLVGNAQATLTNSSVSDNGYRGLWLGASAQATLINSTVSFNGIHGLFLLDGAQATLTNSSVSGNGYRGLELWNRAQITLTNSTVSYNEGSGLVLEGSAQATLTNSTVSNNGAGLFLRDSAQATLFYSTVSNNGKSGLSVIYSATVTLSDSTVSNNGWTGLWVTDSATVEVRGSTLEGNGTDPDCQQPGPEWGKTCSGIAVRDESQTVIIDSRIINNTDWGVAASLEKCGYDWSYFVGKVVFEGHNVIEGNNKSGNHKGNPGNHPWNRPGVPDGQVCLP